MAFTETQKVQLRKWLGYPALHRQVNTWLESAIDVVGGMPESQLEVEAILAKLATVDPSIDDSMTSAGLKRAEDLEWYQGGAVMTGVARVGQMYCQRLSTIFAIPLGDDAFGQAPSGGPIPLG